MDESVLSGILGDATDRNNIDTRDKEKINRRVKEKNKRRIQVGKIDNDEKIQYSKLTEPLVQTMKSDNLELASLAISALINLSHYAPESKSIFFALDGMDIIQLFLSSKNEMLLLSTLRLVFAFVEDSEQSTRMFAQANDSKSVKSLLKILKGPGIGNLKYETRLYYYIIMILHRFILHYS